MGDYSKFFSHREVYSSSDVPPPAAQACLRELCAEVLDPIREALGCPLVITSGYRGPEHNRAIGGAKDSQHVKGRAADIVAGDGRSGLALFEAVAKLIGAGKLSKLGGLGLYHDERAPGSFIHVDTRPKPEGLVVTWYQNAAHQYVNLPAHACKILNAHGVRFC